MSYYLNYTSGQGYVPKRVTVKEELSYSVITNGINNTYPQQAQEALLGSATAFSCSKVLADFLGGDGFANEVFGASIVNSEGLTVNELLYLTAVSLSQHNGFSWLLNYNLLGQVSSIEFVEFDMVRLSKPDSDGYVYTAKLWDDWAHGSVKNNPTRSDIMEVCLFNPATALEEIEKVGIENYNGQLLYWHNQSGYYPKSTIDSCFDDCLSEAKLSEFLVNFINNGFSASTILVNKTLSHDDEAFARMRSQIQDLAGARNAGAVGYLEGEIESLDVTSRQFDKDSEAAAKFIRNKILTAFNMPPILAGVVREGGFPNIDEMENAFRSFNGNTRRMRKKLEAIFKRVFGLFMYNANPSGNYTIIEKSYTNKQDLVNNPAVWGVFSPDEQKQLVAQMFDISVPEKQKTKNTTANESENPAQAKAQAELRGSVGGVQGILSIVDNFKRGIISQNAALTVLEEIYGFSTEIATKMLI